MFSVCSHLGGRVPISHNALQHYPECHGADTCGGVPISHNALQHYPEFHGADTWGGGSLPGPAGGGTLPGGALPGGVPCQGVPCWGSTLLGGYPARRGTLPGGTLPLLGGTPPARPGRGGTLPGGYPVRTTEGVLTTRRAVCLLRSRRRTLFFLICGNSSSLYCISIFPSLSCT